MKKALAMSVLAAGAAALLVAVSAGADPPDDLQVAKAASARYHSLAQAKRDGYVRESPCISSPDGAMGFHYVNDGLARDPAVDPEHPEMLLYVPDSGGRPQLVGVEYFKADADQDLSTDADRPSLFGRAFDGPMEGHGPGMPIHYDLHVWLWAKNPSGMFAPFNPSLSCPS